MNEQQQRSANIPENQQNSSFFSFANFDNQNLQSQLKVQKQTKSSSIQFKLPFSSSTLFGNKLPVMQKSTSNKNEKSKTMATQMLGENQGGVKGSTTNTPQKIMRFQSPQQNKQDFKESNFMQFDANFFNSPNRLQFDFKYQQNQQQQQPELVDINQTILKLERKLVKIRDDQRMKEKEQQIHHLKKEIKDLEQDLLLTKIDLAQAKGELDEYEYQIDEFQRVIKQENNEDSNNLNDNSSNNSDQFDSTPGHKQSNKSDRKTATSKTEKSILVKEASVKHSSTQRSKSTFKYKNIVKYPVSLLTKTQIVNQVKVGKFLKKLNPFGGSVHGSDNLQDQKTEDKEVKSQYNNDDPIFGNDSMDDTPVYSKKGANSENLNSNMQFSDIDMGISTAVSMAAPIRDIRQETLSAAVYLNYFQKIHDEKHIDQWFKVYLPMIKDSYEDDYKRNKKLKQEIINGIPVPLRGQVWQAMVGNQLRVSSFLFQVFKVNGQHDMQNIESNNPKIRLNPLIEEDIPRTFPHLNVLFEEIQSLSTSLREILLAYQNFRQDIGYVQGMSYVAGMLLLHCGPPEDCFKIFCNILNMELIFNFYNFKMNEIQKTYKVYWKLLQEQAPLLYDNLKNEHVSCSVFLFEWILTLFSSSFEIEICTYLWDQIFFFGDRYIIKIAITICQVLQKKYINEMDTIDGLAIIKRARLHIQKDELFEQLNKIKLDLGYIDSLLYKVLSENNKIYRIKGARQFSKRQYLYILISISYKLLNIFIQVLFI